MSAPGSRRETLPAGPLPPPLQHPTHLPACCRCPTPLPRRPWPARAPGFLLVPQAASHKMQFSRKSFSNLAALAQGDFGGSTGELQGGGPLSHATAAVLKGSRTSMDDMDGRKTQRWVWVDVGGCGHQTMAVVVWQQGALEGHRARHPARCCVLQSPTRPPPLTTAFSSPPLCITSPLLCRLIFVTNHLPLKVGRDEASGVWTFERDDDALVMQAKGGLPEDMEAIYVGCLPVEIEGHEQEVRRRAMGGAARWSGVQAGWRAGRGRLSNLEVADTCASFPPSRPLPLCCQVQDVTQQLMADFNCYPVFLGTELKTNYYKSECGCAAP